MKCNIWFCWQISPVFSSRSISDRNSNLLLIWYSRIRLPNYDFHSLKEVSVLLFIIQLPPKENQVLTFPVVNFIRRGWNFGSLPSTTTFGLLIFLPTLAISPPLFFLHSNTNFYRPQQLSSWRGGFNVRNGKQSLHSFDTSSRSRTIRCDQQFIPTNWPRHR